MKVTAVETLSCEGGWRIHNFVKLTTDAGLVGYACLVGGLAACRVVGLLLDGFSAEMVSASILELGLTAFTLFVRGRLQRETTAATA